MGLWTRIKGLLTRESPKPNKKPKFMRIRDDEIMDDSERAMYEAVINAAFQGGESFAVRGEDNTVNVNGVKYESPEAARAAVKAEIDG